MKNAIIEAKAKIIILSALSAIPTPDMSTPAASDFALE